METRFIEPWDELLEFFAERHENDFVYRGVTHSDHELIPKIGRAGMLETRYSKAVEEQIIFNFLLWAQPHIPQLPSDGNYLVTRN